MTLRESQSNQSVKKQSRYKQRDSAFKNRTENTRNRNKVPRKMEYIKSNMFGDILIEEALQHSEPDYTLRVCKGSKNLEHDTEWIPNLVMSNTRTSYVFIN